MILILLLFRSISPKLPINPQKTHNTLHVIRRIRNSCLLHSTSKLRIAILTIRNYTSNLGFTPLQNSLGLCQVESRNVSSRFGLQKQKRLKEEA